LPSPDHAFTRPSRQQKKQETQQLLSGAVDLPLSKDRAYAVSHNKAASCWNTRSYGGIFDILVVAG